MSPDLASSACAGPTRPLAFWLAREALYFFRREHT